MGGAGRRGRRNLVKKPPAGIDSSSCSARTREALFPRILAAAACRDWHRWTSKPSTASTSTTPRARRWHGGKKLGCAPSAVLVIGDRLPKLDIPAKALVGGDELSMSIAAASIIAKVTREGSCGTFA